MNDKPIPIPSGVSTIPWGRLSDRDRMYVQIIGERARLGIRMIIEAHKDAGNPKRMIDPDPLLIAMDVAAAHLARDCKLDLEALAHYPEHELLADVLAIQRAIDRTSGAFPFYVRLKCDSPRIVRF